MKKEVQLTLIVETDDNDKDIQNDLETEISCCYNYFEVVKCDISDVKDNKC